MRVRAQPTARLPMQHYYWHTLHCDTCDAPTAHLETVITYFSGQPPRPEKRVARVCPACAVGWGFIRQKIPHHVDRADIAAVLLLIEK